MDEVPTVASGTLGHDQSTLDAIRFAARIVWRSAPRPSQLVVFLQLVGTGLSALQLLLLARLVDAVSSGQQSDLLVDLTPELLLFGFTLIANGWIGSLTAETELYAMELVGRDSSLIIADTAAQTPYEQFEDADFHDRLARASASSGSSLYNLVFGTIALLSSFIYFVAVAIVLAVLAPMVLVIAALAALPIIVSSRINTKRLYRYTYELTEEDRRRSYLQSTLLSRLTAPELNVLGARKNIRRRIDELFEDRIGRTLQLVRDRLPITFTSIFVSAVIGTAAAALLIHQIGAGALSLSEAAVAFVALQQVRGQANGMAGNVAEIHQGAAFVGDASEFLISDPDASALEVASLPPLEQVRATSVSFTYPGNNKPAVDGVTLEIAAGEVVALVGENGSGKTTLSRLLAGLYESDEGQITWNDIVITPETMPRVAPVFQRFNRYALSAIDNITLGEPDEPEDRDRARIAAQAAGIADTIEAMPLGYDTQLAREFENGVDLSGGEWQRLAIARALYRDAPFIILDEPTASIDARAETALFDALRSLAVGKAVLLISHRFSTVRDADKIVVLHDGAVEEAGTHDELMANGGRYSELFRLQASPYFDEMN